MYVVWQILWNFSTCGISYYAWQTCCRQPQQILLVSSVRADASLASCNKILSYSSRCGILTKLIQSAVADGSRLSTLSLLCELYSVCTVRLLLYTVIFWSISLHLTLFCELHTQLERHPASSPLNTDISVDQSPSNGRVCACSDRVVMSCCL